mgnify:FL=1
MTKPNVRPKRLEFSSGPCIKPPGWSLENLRDAPLGKSHRSAIGKQKLKAVIDESHALLGMPVDYILAIVPGSDTGALEMALWSMLGARGVDVLAWENFGNTWAVDVEKHLKLENFRLLDAPYGAMPNLADVNFDNDVIFTWNGTTSGVRVPNGDWIDADRKGLTICDATSAVYCMDIPWDKLDVVTWSWQKALGGEAAHGMLALSPRAVERLETYMPPWPLPKVFRLAKGGKLNEGVFRGETINTPSMLCVEDALFGLAWAKSIGGLSALTARSQRSLATVAAWVEKTDWIDFLADDPATRSCTSMCLKISEASGLSLAERAEAPQRISALLEAEEVAYDIKGHKEAAPNLRIWGGPTVDPEDIEALLPWLDWAFNEMTRTAAA